MIPLLPSSPLILDVGGGSGELGLTLLSSLPSSLLIIWDLNIKSLTRCLNIAKQNGLDDRLTLIQGMFPEEINVIHGSESISNINFITSLHGCGDLTTELLSYAKVKRTDYLIVPCCYSKIKSLNVDRKILKFIECNDVINEVEEKRREAQIKVEWVRGGRGEWVEGVGRKGYFVWERFGEEEEEGVREEEENVSKEEVVKDEKEDDPEYDPVGFWKNWGKEHDEGCVCCFEGLGSVM